jgi:type II secretory pathway pseudopilin PulG
LLEIIMVVLVIGIASAVMVPEMMRAVDGSHLRDALQNVISINRYARSRAILDRRPYAILYHKDTLEVQLVALPARAAMPSVDQWMEPPPRTSDREGWERPDTGIEPVRMVSLHETLQLADVEGAQREEDTWFVLYTDSGMTDPHTVELVNVDGDSTFVRVSGITGEIRIRE